LVSIPVVDPSARGRANGREARSEDDDVYGEYDESERRSIVVVQPAEARRDYWNRHLGQVEALAAHDGGVVVADGSSVRIVDRGGATRTLADEVGKGLQGLVLGPRGPILAVYETREVVEIAWDGSRRVLLTAEPPWGPTDVALGDGVLHVLEIARHPCCWKGPRIRRVVDGKAPVTLLAIDDRHHEHSSPWRPFGLGVLAGAGLLAGLIAAGWAIRSTVRRLARRGRGG
jgi:hypothetical protein